MSDSKEKVLRCLPEYQKVKIYTLNIVDIVITALAAVTNIAIVAYDLDGLTVKNHVFKPTKKLSIAVNEVCFINGHYELFVDAFTQAELNMKVSFLNKISKHQPKKLFKNFHHQKLNIPYNSFHRHKIIRGKTGFTDFLNFDTVVVGSEGNVVVLEALKGLFQYGYY